MVEFQNPSIKDFTLEYIRRRTDLVEILIRGAHLFNQLFSIFSTQPDDRYIEQDDFDHGYSGSKITLNTHAIAILQEKIIGEFDELNCIQFEKVHWESGGTTYHLKTEKAENRLNKLWRILTQFDISNNLVIRGFVLSKYQEVTDIHITEEGERVTRLSLTERLSLPDLLERLIPYGNFDGQQLITSFHTSIKFSQEYIALHYLGSLFPVEWKNFKHSLGKRKMVASIKELIYDDFDHFLWEGTLQADRSIDELKDELIPEFEELFGVKLSANFRREINEMAGYEIFWLTSKSDLIDETEENNSSFWESSKDGDLFPDKDSVNLLSQVQNHLFPSGDEYSEEDEITNFDSEVDQWTVILSTCDNKLVRSLSTICYHAFFEEILYFRKDHLLKLLSLNSDFPERDLDELVNLCLIIQEGTWFKVMNSSLVKYLTANYILEMNPSERIRMYQEMRNEYHWHYEYISDVWKVLNEKDYELFKLHLWESCLVEMLSACTRTEAVAENFLIYLNLCASFSFTEDEELDMKSSSHDHPLFEDLCQFFGVTYDFYELMDHFNYSTSNHAGKIVTYLQKYCKSKKDNSFFLDFEQEIKRMEFQELVKDIGLNTYVVAIIDEIKRRLNSISSE